MIKRRSDTFWVSLLTILVFFLTSLAINKGFAAPNSDINDSASTASVHQAKKRLVYLVSDTRIPFWTIMSRGIKDKASKLGYELEIMSAENSARRELEFTVSAIKNKVSGIIVSPTTSSACATILKFSEKAGIPVVISDIGTDGGEYVSFISSDNQGGAYNIGKVLTKRLLELGWEKGTVGIVAIPQKRLNGQARTAGFMKALSEAGIKGADIKQQSTFSEVETYTLSKNLIDNHPDLRAIWLQGSDRYSGALKAIADAGRKDDILLITFDAEPEFLELIPKGVLLGSAMQQPYLMGEEAVNAMHQYLNGKPVNKNLSLPILAISRKNITKKLTVIKRNVLGIETSN